MNPSQTMPFWARGFPRNLPCLWVQYDGWLLHRKRKKHKQIQLHRTLPQVNPGRNPRLGVLLHLPGGFGVEAPRHQTSDFRTCSVRAWNSKVWVLGSGRRLLGLLECKVQCKASSQHRRLQEQLRQPSCWQQK